jgi:hypothetical protein
MKLQDRTTNFFRIIGGYLVVYYVTAIISQSNLYAISIAIAIYSILLAVNPNLPIFVQSNGKYSDSDVFIIGSLATSLFLNVVVLWLSYTFVQSYWLIVGILILLNLSLLLVINQFRTKLNTHSDEKQQNYKII